DHDVGPSRAEPDERLPERRLPHDRRRRRLHSSEPPFTWTTVPVTKVESGESRKMHAPAISYGWPRRPNSVREPAIARCSGVAASSAGVSVGPGETALTRVPAGDTSRASDFVS